MAIFETDWQSFLSRDSEIPPDVFFAVDDSGDDSSISSELIGAQKIFLAGVSPVLRGMFFGPMKEEKEVIEIKETTHEAFTTMIS